MKNILEVQEEIIKLVTKYTFASKDFILANVIDERYNIEQILHRMIMSSLLHTFNFELNGFKHEVVVPRAFKPCDTCY